MITDHRNADGGSDPCSASPDPPEKLIVSPTFHVKEVLGVLMNGVGGVSLTLTTVEATSERPWLSLTRTRTVTASCEALVYVNCGAWEVASSNAPSPSRSHA